MRLYLFQPLRIQSKYSIVIALPPLLPLIRVGRTEQTLRCVVQPNRKIIWRDCLPIADTFYGYCFGQCFQFLLACEVITNVSVVDFATIVCGVRVLDEDGDSDGGA